MKSKQNRALKEFDSLYKMIDDVYHEICLRYSRFILEFISFDEQGTLHGSSAKDQRRI